MLVKVSGIHWETDGRDIDLPDSVTMDVPDGTDDDEIIDKLSDEYGWLVSGVDNIESGPRASEVMVCIGRWDLLPPSWEGINGLYHQPAKAIIKEAERERNLLDWDVKEGLGPDDFVGVMTLEQFEEESNNWVDDGHEDFTPASHWVKFVTEFGTIVNGYDRKAAEEAEEAKKQGEKMSKETKKAGKKPTKVQAPKQKLQEMKHLKLANPVTYTANKIASLFDGAKGITTKFEFRHRVLRIYVENAEQAEALAKMLKPRHDFGGLYLDVAVYPGNGKRIDVKKLKGCESDAEAFECMKLAMKGNKYKSNAFYVDDPVMGTRWYFVEFAKKVCQYNADNMANAHGVESALPEDVAKLAFEVGAQVHLSTTYVK